MKIRIDRGILAEAVAWAARSLPSRPAMPVLTGLLIKTFDQSVSLSTFDYETSARIECPAHIIDEGEVLVSGKLLADIARSLPHMEVEIEADATRAELRCGPAQFTLQALPLDEYPQLPSMPAATGVIDSALFAQSIQQTVIAAGKDELLPIFTGVKIEIDNNTLSMLATDRFRMSLKEFTWDSSSEITSTSALVPAKVLTEVARTMTSGETVTIALSNPQMGEGIIGIESTVNDVSRRITTRLLSGEFPKVRHLMDVTPSLVMRCNTNDLVASVKRVSLVAERNTPIRMLIADDQIALEAATGDQAQASESISAQVTNHLGEENALSAAGFNPHFLSDALSALNTPYVQISFTAPGKPCLIQGIDSIDAEADESYKHVIMLMRLPS